MKYLKKFDTTEEYNSFKNSNDFIRPNISICLQESKVIYNPDVHEYIDLGLPSGTLWATTNIGAESPYEAGLFFAWGETRGYKVNEIDVTKRLFYWRDYKFSGTLDANGTNPQFSKYGPIDNVRFLQLEDDAAKINWGSLWEIPSANQFQELIDNTTTSYDSQLKVLTLTSNINGNILMFFGAGRFGNASSGNGFLNDGYVILMTNELYNTNISSNSNSTGAKAYFGGSNLNQIGSCHRYYGIQIRPVKNS